MARRFAVSVSDELGQRFEPFKDKLSPSAIFQKALESVVEREERFANSLKGDQDMEAIIERLKGEKAETMQNTYELGREEGLAWAKSAHYESLLAAVSFEPPRESNGEMLDFADYREDEDTMPYVLHEFFKEHPEYYTEEPYLSEAAKRYVTGFLESVGDFWKEVSSRLD